MGIERVSLLRLVQVQRALLARAVPRRLVQQVREQRQRAQVLQRALLARVVQRRLVQQVQEQRVLGQQVQLALRQVQVLQRRRERRLLLVVRLFDLRLASL